MLRFFDVVLGSDIVYEPSSAAMIARVVLATLRHARAAPPLIGLAVCFDGAATALRPDEAAAAAGYGVDPAAADPAAADSAAAALP